MIPQFYHGDVPELDAFVKEEDGDADEEEEYDDKEVDEKEDRTVSYQATTAADSTESSTVL